MDQAFVSAGFQVPSRLQQPFLAWKDRLLQKPTPPLHLDGPNGHSGMVNSVSFPPILGQKGSLRAKSRTNQKFRARNQPTGKMSELRSLSRIISCPSASVNHKESLRMPRTHSHTWLHTAPERDSDRILSLHTQWCCLESHTNTIKCEPISL